MIWSENCTQCPRLAEFLAGIRLEFPHYHARPVSPFGAAKPRLLIVGLAPGMHGANATGRPFTGDHAGILLYNTLFKYGFSNQPQSSHLGDGLVLQDCRITNAVKCLPPQNKPTLVEVNQCNTYLAQELASLAEGTLVLALGNIAHQATLKALGKKVGQFRFAHGAEHVIEHVRLIDSYHCSRYNTQTRRLTEEMFERLFQRIRDLLG